MCRTGSIRRSSDPTHVLQLRLQRRGTLQAGDEVFSFSNRILEEAHVYGTFVCALPRALRARPQARVVMSGLFKEAAKTPSADPTWRSVADELDQSRVDFLGRLPAGQRARLFQVSTACVYLTDPAALTPISFKAMAAGCMIIASDGGAVREVIELGRTRILSEFHGPQSLAEMLIALLANADQTRILRIAGREIAMSIHGLQTCVIRGYVKLIQSIV